MRSIVCVAAVLLAVCVARHSEHVLHAAHLLQRRVLHVAHCDCAVCGESGNPTEPEMHFCSEKAKKFLRTLPEKPRTNFRVRTTV